MLTTRTCINENLHLEENEGGACANKGKNASFTGKSACVGPLLGVKGREEKITLTKVYIIY